MVSLREFASVAAVAFAAMGIAALVEHPPVNFANPIAHSHSVAASAQFVVSAAPGGSARPRTLAIKVAHRPLPPNVIAVAPLPPQVLTPDPMLAGQPNGTVAAHLIAKVPAALAPYFDIYLYVSKASAGAWAQHLFVFRKNADGSLAFEESFAVSTGREQSEQYFTATPAGLFELDSHRFMRMAYSNKWNDAQMPWAMFLNYAYRTSMTGVALHAAIGGHEIADLGRRASGGCVRLPIDKAEAFFHRFQQDMPGQVPVFAFDPLRGTTNVDGEIQHDDAGHILVADGVRVLVVIDGEPGGLSPQS